MGVGWPWALQVLGVKQIHVHNNHATCELATEAEHRLRGVAVHRHVHCKSPRGTSCVGPYGYSMEEALPALRCLQSNNFYSFVGKHLSRLNRHRDRGGGGGL